MYGSAVLFQQTGVLFYVLNILKILAAHIHHVCLLHIIQ